MNESKLAIIETYPSLGFGPEVWTHYFSAEVDAQWNMRELRRAHPHRTYEAVGFVEHP